MVQAVKGSKVPPTSFQRCGSGVTGRVWYARHLKTPSVSAEAADPSAASADKPKQLVEAAIRELSHFVREFRELRV
jgi:creatinine amidohydrolase/Fe(II)-dependent formamide hydrolase-like protein